jgi:hypothetical protein
VFAAAASSIKLENKGPFKGKRKLIEDRCKWAPESIIK